jgi:zinc D-Ala-D-Ala carboxypeptidase
MTRRAFIKLAAMALFLARTSPLGGQELFGPTGQGDQPGQRLDDAQLKDYLVKIRNPDAYHPDDIVLDAGQQQLLGEVMERLERLCLTVGNGNYTLLGFDEALAIARKNSSVGAFTRVELDFMEMIYSRDADDYGFYGSRQVVTLLQVIDDEETVKIPQTGNFLFKGQSLEKYERIKRDLGEEVILTSGIRGIVKQFHLFLGKARRHGGNLSLASRSLAPPGYSYHATGDFDIGQKGLGEGNFSEMFITTPVFKRLAEEGFVDYRYWRDNRFGVRYEPWHIKL